jgi:hypothetical protein
MSNLVESIENQLAQLSLAEIADLQERIATHLRQRLVITKKDKSLDSLI